MHLELSPRQCVSCPSEPPACSCSADTSCVQITRSCNTCSYFVCQPLASNSSGGTVSSGALAGAIVAVLLVLIGVLVVFFLYRRRQRARQCRDVAVEPKPDVPVPAEAVLNRPDPTENSLRSSSSTPTTRTNTVRVYSSTGDSIIDLDPRSRTGSSSFSLPDGQPVGNPFDDGQSIQTTSTTTNGTNVIPIALVPPGSVHPSLHPESNTPAANSPIRPSRPVHLVLEAPRRSLDTLHQPSPHYAQSQRSGVSRNSYNSYTSNVSYSSDFLNEAPMIVTQTQGAVRQVVGKVKAEIIQTSGAVAPTDSLKPLSLASRPSVRSPLAATSFGPADVVHEADEEHVQSARSDPFGDHHVPSGEASTETDLNEPALPAQPRLTVDVANASGAKDGPLATRSGPQTPGGSSARPSPSPILPSTLQEQQQRALAHAQAQARAQGLDKSKRMSGTSVVSTTSTRADSILESFPFVPPSPISSRPVRSPPRSPLGQQFAAASQPQTPLAAAEATTSQTARSSTETTGGASLPPLDPPPSRRILGMSTGSQLSTASSGLGNFPFQIDHGGTEGTRFPSQPRQRASLDTLALMNDLSSFPLGYDRDE